MITEDDQGRPKCVCDVCGHEWLPRRNKEPYKCPKLKCQSTQWNDDEMVLTQLDQLSLLKELDRRNKNQGDEYGMDSELVDSKVRKTIEQMKHEENLSRSLHNTNERLEKMEEILDSLKLEDCPGCKAHKVPHGAKFCPECGEELDWSE